MALTGDALDDKMNIKAYNPDVTETNSSRYTEIGKISNRFQYFGQLGLGKYTHRGFDRVAISEVLNSETLGKVIEAGDDVECGQVRGKVLSTEVVDDLVVAIQVELIHPYVPIPYLDDPTLYGHDTDVSKTMWIILDKDASTKIINEETIKNSEFALYKGIVNVKKNPTDDVTTWNLSAQKVYQFNIDNNSGGNEFEPIELVVNGNLDIATVSAPWNLAGAIGFTPGNPNGGYLEHNVSGDISHQQIDVQAGTIDASWLLELTGTASLQSYYIGLTNNPADPYADPNTVYLGDYTDTSAPNISNESVTDVVITQSYSHVFILSDVMDVGVKLQVKNVSIIQKTIDA